MPFNISKLRLSLYVSSFALSILSCNGIFAPEEMINTIFQIENTSANNIKLIRYKVSSDEQDTLHLIQDQIFSQKESGTSFGSAPYYFEVYDSVQVVYNDSISITHSVYDQSQTLNRSMFYPNTWEFVKKKKIKNWLTEITRKYSFTDQDFEEAKQKGHVIQ